MAFEQGARVLRPTGAHQTSPPLGHASALANSCVAPVRSKGFGDFAALGRAQAAACHVRPVSARSMLAPPLAGQLFVAQARQVCNLLARAPRRARIPTLSAQLANGEEVVLIAV